MTENEGTQAGVVAEGGRGGAARRRPEGRGESWLVGGSWGGPRAPWAWYGDGGWGGGGWGGAGERRGYQKMNGRDGMDGHALREDEGRDRSGGRRGPPHMGELKRRADAQAPVLRAQLRAVMRLDGLSVEEVARRARLDLAALAAFAAGASINPRWQEKLARWLDDATDHPVDASGDALGGASGDASGDASGGALG